MEVGECSWTAAAETPRWRSNYSNGGSSGVRDSARGIGRYDDWDKWGNPWIIFSCPSHASLYLIPVNIMLNLVILKCYFHHSKIHCHNVYTCKLGFEYFNALHTFYIKQFR